MHTLSSGPGAKHILAAALAMWQLSTACTQQSLACAIRYAAAAVPGQTPPDYYTSNVTKSTFIYHSDLLNSTEGYARCNNQGGHMASFAR